jgi:NADH-quinone oxidoreductase subunit A
MSEISGFGTVLLFIVGAIGLIIILLFVGKILRPNNPNDEKLTTYESGEVPVGSAWGKFNVRFYVIALIFLLFEAELVFLFPWATIFGDENLINESNGLWSQFSLIETFIFIGILGVGLAYVWAKGMLDWVKPRPKGTNFKSQIPLEEYQKFNERN